MDRPYPGGRLCSGLAPGSLSVRRENDRPRGKRGTRDQRARRRRAGRRRRASRLQCRSGCAMYLGRSGSDAVALESRSFDLLFNVTALDTLDLPGLRRPAWTMGVPGPIHQFVVGGRAACERDRAASKWIAEVLAADCVQHRGSKCRASMPRRKREIDQQPEPRPGLGRRRDRPVRAVDSQRRSAGAARPRGDRHCARVDQRHSTVVVGTGQPAGHTVRGFAGPTARTGEWCWCV
jgi:hypothetical protein